MARTKSAELKQRFISEAYDGDKRKYLRERKEDYCSVQFMWSCWIDALCKAGEITQKQYEKAVF